MLIFAIILFTLLSAIFSGMEIAYVSANRVGIEIEKNKKSLTARIINTFYKDPREFIGVMLVGNNIALVALTFFFSELIDPFFLQYLSNYYIILLIKTLVITIFTLIFAEFIPKAIFTAYSNEAVVKLAFPVYVLKLILQIPTFIFTALAGFLLKYIFRTKLSDDMVPLSRVDLEHYIEENLTEEHDVEKDMFQKALNLNQVKARDVMIPRNEIVTIDKSASKKELIEMFENSKHSRIIIIDDDIENILGYIHHQQLINENFRYAGDHIMPIVFFPETMNAKDLLLQFIREKQNIGIVVDEYGGVAGLITMEDLAEEIFGEIDDEYDIDEEGAYEKELGNGEFVFSGRLEIDYLNEKYDGLELPEGEYNTLSGLVVMTLGLIPEQGTDFEIENFNFKVLKMSKNKIELLKIRKLEEVGGC